MADEIIFQQEITLVGIKPLSSLPLVHVLLNSILSGLITGNGSSLLTAKFYTVQRLTYQVEAPVALENHVHAYHTPPLFLWKMKLHPHVFTMSHVGIDSLFILCSSGRYGPRVI